MPGFVLTTAGTVTCSHQGKATPGPPLSRVSILGARVVTIATPYVIGDCKLPSMTSGAPPCASGRFKVAAQQVTSMGQPLVIVGSTSTCEPTVQPLLITATQGRVRAR